MPARRQPDLLNVPLGRREFLRRAGQAALAATVLSGRAWRAWAAPSPAAQAGRRGHSLVQAVLCPRAVEGARLDVGRLRDMLDQGVMGLADAQTPSAGWAAFVQPGQRLLLKFDSSVGAALKIGHGMLEALLGCLQAAGHSRSRIRVADCDAAASLEGLDPLPPGWADRTVRIGGQDQQLRRYLLDVDAIINVPCLTDHHLLGLACGLTNLSLTVIRRPGRHLEDDLHQAVVSVWTDPVIGARTRLTIVNALRAVYDGGPMINERAIETGQVLWLSADPVAADCLAGEWLDNIRRYRGLPTLDQAHRPPAYLTLADHAGLGHADPRHIVCRRYRL